MPPIPWATILKHAPTIVAAAERLLGHTASNRFNKKTEGIEARLDRLEDTSAESAKLLREMAQQIQAIAAAQEAMVRRTRIGVTLAAVAVVLAFAAFLIAIIW